MTLYILKYNNYYNRLVKSESTLDEYKQYLIYPQTEIGIIKSVNFNPNDGVNTQHVIGVGEYDGTGDYIITVDEDGSILSRWFIIDSVRTRAGQYNLTLRRDLIVDYYNIIVQSPMFIEKATISSINDPAIFNREGMTFNQIKQSEYLLKDETNCPWIVGYIPETVVKGNNYNGETILFDYSIESKDFIEVDKLEDWDGYNYYIGKNIKRDVIKDLYYGYGVTVPAGENNKYFVREQDGQTVKLSNSSLPSNGYYFFKDNSPIGANKVDTLGYLISENPLWNVFNVWLPKGWSKAITGFNAKLKGYLLGNLLDEFYTYDGINNGLNPKIRNVDIEELKRLWDDYDTTGNYTPESVTNFKNKYDGLLLHDKSTGLSYKVRVVKSEKPYVSKKFLTVGTEIFLYIDSRLDRSKTTDAAVKVVESLEGNPTNQTYFVASSFYTYTLNLEPVYQYAGIQLDSSVYELNDQPYYMFCMPYTNDITVVKSNKASSVDIKYKFTKDLTISLATQFAGKAGKENVFDIQMLPFCPARYAVSAFMETPGWHINEETGEGSGTGLYKNVKTKYIFDESLFSGLFQPILKGSKSEDAEPVLGNEEIGKLFWATAGNFSFDIEYSIPAKENALDTKIASETELYRLCSPNYSGVFEFDPYMNNGVLIFNVDCSYKPFNPYIHINPVFNYLYGSDFNDQRGLIIQGDFSLPQETNSWTQYELNNKNYQVMFDRQIQNLKVNQDVQRKQQVFNAVTGTVGGSLSGATTGALASGGNPYAAIAGGLAGGIASGIGGGLDIKYGDLLRSEALDYTLDMFNYNLGNIKALPNGITKTSPLTTNFKFYPFIEKYDCTNIEKLAFINKLYYNGMTIMRIGTISEFIQDTPTYIKGKLIRLENTNEDYHIINSIAGELNKGVFI